MAWGSQAASDSHPTPHAHEHSFRPGSPPACPEKIISRLYGNTFLPSSLVLSCRLCHGSGVNGSWRVSPSGAHRGPFFLVGAHGGPWTKDKACWRPVSPPLLQGTLVTLQVLSTEGRSTPTRLLPIPAIHIEQEATKKLIVIPFRTIRP